MLDENDWHKYYTRIKEVNYSMAFFQKKITQQPQLDMTDANKILENVFRENHVEPNSVPLELLTAYSNYRKERFFLQRLLIVIIMILFCMLPFLFIPSSFSITENTKSENNSPTYILNVTSKMPVKRVSAMINGRNLPVYETDTHVYSIEPTVNGKMTVTVTLINNQTSTRYIDVTTTDAEAPILLSSNIDNSLVYLYLSDSASGIDYDNIVAIDLNGKTISPISIDKASGCVAFPYPDSIQNVYVPDFSGNKLQLVIQIKQ